MKMKNKQKNSKLGFTLLELLVVVLIIGILTAIALPQYRFAVDKTKFYKLKSFAKPFVVAYQNFYMINNQFPNSFEDLDISLPDGYTKRTTYGGKASCGIMNDFYCCMVPQGTTATAAITCGDNDYNFGIWITSPQTTRPYAFCAAKEGNTRAETLCTRLGKSYYGMVNYLTPYNFSEGTHVFWHLGPF